MAVDQPICVIDGCEKPVLIKMRGLCSSHYQRWRTHGDPTAGRCLHSRTGSVHQRIEATGWDVLPGGCWKWRGRLSLGYAHITVRGVLYVVSREVLKADGRPPPFDEAVARHRCDFRSCVNPAHLEWGTKADNTQDMVDRRREVSYRTDWWDGLCRNGLHDITLPGAIIQTGPATRCAECYRITREKKNRRRREQRAARRRQQQ